MGAAFLAFLGGAKSYNKEESHYHLRSFYKVKISPLSILLVSVINKA